MNCSAVIKCVYIDSISDISEPERHNALAYSDI